MNKQDTKKVGEIAMELISDYPLYASTCGITYEEAIKVAQAIYGKDLIKAKKELDEIENMSMEELEKELGIKA